MAKDDLTTQSVVIQDLLDFISDITDGSFINPQEIVSQTGLPEERAEEMAALASKIVSGDITAKDIKS